MFRNEAMQVTDLIIEAVKDERSEKRPILKVLRIGLVIVIIMPLWLDYFDYSHNLHLIFIYKFNSLFFQIANLK